MGTGNTFHNFFCCSARSNNGDTSNSYCRRYPRSCSHHISLLFNIAGSVLRNCIRGFLWVFYRFNHWKFASKTIAGFTAGYFSAETKKEINISTYIFSLIVFICALIDSIIFSFFSAFDVQTNIFKLLFQQALLPSLYTAIVSILFIFSPFKRRKF